MHPSRGIGGAGAQGDKCHARAARQLTMRFGHHRNAAFLASDYGFYIAFEKPI